MAMFTVDGEVASVPIGWTRSDVNEMELDAVEGLPAASRAAPPGIWMETAPVLIGVTVKLKVVLEGWFWAGVTRPMEPLVTEGGRASVAPTGWEKTTVAVNDEALLAELGAGGQRERCAGRDGVDREAAGERRHGVAGQVPDR